MTTGPYGQQGEPIRVADTQDEQRESRVAPPVTLAAGSEAPLPIHEPSLPPLRPASAAPLPGDAGIERDEKGLSKPEPHDASPVQDVTLLAVRALVTQWTDTAETTPIRSERNRGQREATLACADELRRVLGI